MSSPGKLMFLSEREFFHARAGLSNIWNKKNLQIKLSVALIGYINSQIIVELKAIQNLAKEHEIQLVNYLNCLKKEIGLLTNFGPSGMVIKRKYRSLKKLINPEIIQIQQDAQKIY
jgi:GxxExxY protein